MAIAYRAASATTQGNASGAALVVTKPTGTVDGDLIVVSAYLESDTNSWASIGSGFTLVSVAIRVNTGLFRLDYWWKIAAAEPASWTWTPTTTAWRTVAALAYTGATGSGERVDIHGGLQGDAAITYTCPSVTTTAANDMLLAFAGNFAASVYTWTGAAPTERVDFGGVGVADALVAAIGATGTTTPSSGTSDYVTAHIAFLEIGAGGGVTAFPWSRQAQQNAVYRM